MKSHSCLSAVGKWWLLGWWWGRGNPFSSGKWPWRGCPGSSRWPDTMRLQSVLSGLTGCLKKERDHMKLEGKVVREIDEELKGRE